MSWWKDIDRANDPLMEVTFGQISLIGFKGSILIVLLSSLLLAFVGFFLDKRRKAPTNKALLKALLEDLGLDVPLELQDTERPAMKSLKKF